MIVGASMSNRRLEICGGDWRRNLVFRATGPLIRPPSSLHRLQNSECLRDADVNFNNRCSLYYGTLMVLPGYSGYDIEDAIIMNRAALDRGFGRP